MIPEVPQIITTDLESQPAVRAWLALPALADGFTPAVPERLELLHQSRKSRVYLLPRVGVGGSGVIAKHCPSEVAQWEREVYRLLQRLRCPSLFCYGLVEAPGEEFTWLFLKNAAGRRFDAHRPEHRQLAARWLARLHTASSSLVGSTLFPDRGPSHYLAHLHAGREELNRGQAQRQLSSEDQAVLDEVRRVLDRLESCWSEVEACSHDMPWALVHGDFVKKNLRVRYPSGNGSDASLLAFDWEKAGWGPPAVDLTPADLDVYHANVRDCWPRLTRKTLGRIAHLSTLLRDGTASVHWEATYLETGWLPNIIGNMRLYAERMTAACDALGWNARSS
jgi:thiamine kinase-like enzyme